MSDSERGENATDTTDVEIEQSPPTLEHALSRTHIDTETSPTTSNLASLIPPWAKWIFTDAKGAVAFIAILIYGVVRVAVEAFYQEFHISPDDVGLTQTRILGRAALFLILFLAVFLAAIALSAAFALFIMDLRAKPSTDPSVHLKHRQDRQNVAAGLWGATAAVALLPAGVSVLAPELASWLIGYQGGTSLEASHLRLTLAAWTASLVALAFTAFRASCPSWNRLRAPRRPRIVAALVFVPFAGAIALALFTGSPRYGVGNAFEIALDITVVAWPLVVGLGLFRSYRRANSDGEYLGALGASVIVSSLAFYVLLVPFVLGLLSEGSVRSRFPSQHAFRAATDSSLATRAHLLLSFWPLFVWGVAFVCAARVAWRLGDCTNHSTRRDAPADTALLIGMIAIASFSILFLAGERGRVMAERVMEGDRLRPQGAVVLVTAEPVCIVGVPGLARPGPWMLLGNTSDDLVIYSLFGQNTEVVPKANASLRYINGDVFSDDPSDSKERIRAVATCNAFRAQHVRDAVAAK